MKFLKGCDQAIGRYFRAREMDCVCDQCHETRADPALIQKLDTLREYVGAPITITSGYRCADYQNDLKRRGYETATISQHCFGRAADIKVQGLTGPELERLAEKAGFEAVGVGRTWIHVDTRTGKRRRWGYAVRSG